KTPVRAYFIEDYYRVTQTAYVQALRAKGLSDAEIGSHAGVADTSLTLAIEPDLVRTDRLGSAQNNAANGVLGDPRASTAALGQIGVDLIVTQTVAAIRKARLRQH
ncbi:MAG TPA: creatininase family protein, partial [Reyranella sp.]|nr:creatininase family protein [Reyranella sp.]